MQSGSIVRVVGDVVKSLESGRFLVRLENGHEIVARVVAKSRSFIKVGLGDRVELSASPADMSQGKIDKRI